MRRFAVFTSLVVFASAAAVAAAECPADKVRHATIEVDTTEVPDLTDWARQVKAVAQTWYPIIAFELPVDGYTPPDRVRIVFRKDMRGVAATGGTRVECSAAYFKAHPDDLGAIVHELVHVVQAYPKYDPVWLVEGIADYVRFYDYERPEQRPRPDPRRANYNSGYRTTAAFLDWAARRYDPDLVAKLNAACHQNRYRPELFEQYTGKPLEALSGEWKQSLGKKESQ